MNDRFCCYCYLRRNSGNDRCWPEVRISNSVKLCLYSCRERQVTGQTRNYMKSLYKSPLYFRKRPF